MTHDAICLHTGGALCDCAPVPSADLTAALHAALIRIRGNCRGGHIKDSDCMGMAVELARALDVAA